MKRKEKQGLLILVIATILIVGVIWLITRNKDESKQGNAGTSTGEEYVQVQDDGTKVNTSEKAKETKEIEDVIIENIRITEKNGQTVLIADITNTTEKTKERFLVDIVLYDKAGKEIGKIPGVIGEMQAGETIEMQAGITQDYVNAYDFKIVKK